MVLGILGTKEYRKPEWVTQMEELKDALKGTASCSSTGPGSVCLPSMSSVLSETGMSVDSLDADSLRLPVDGARPNRRHQCASGSWASLGDLSMGSDSVFLSTASSCSDESHYVASHVPFLLNHSALDCHSSVFSTNPEHCFVDEFQYVLGKHEKSTPDCDKPLTHGGLNYSQTSDSNSLSPNCNSSTLLKQNISLEQCFTVSEDASIRSCTLSYPVSTQSSSIDSSPNLLCFHAEERTTPKWENVEYCDSGDNVSDYCTEAADCVDVEDYSHSFLSTILENSEPSNSETCSNSPSDSSFSPCSTSVRNISSSCEFLFSNNFKAEANFRCQTFPRSRVSGLERFGNDVHTSRHRTLYPLEPRELDPASFQQLHTADSSDELQEFLLLESQCMTSEEKCGIASAFDSSGVDLRTD